MDLRRPGSSGLRVAPTGLDLIEDLRRQQRRKVFRRAAKFTALGLALLMVGFAFKVLADRRDAGQSVQRAQTTYVGGSASDMAAAVQILETSLGRHPGHGDTRALEVLMRAHLRLEFGIRSEGLTAELERLAPSPTRHVAEAIMSFSAGQIDEAEAMLDAIGPIADPLLEQEAAWLRGLVASTRQDDDGLVAAVQMLANTLEEHPRSVPVRRVYSLLLLLEGSHDQALEELAKARDQSRSHFGLAADEALYNAYLHRELGGVASVADQLLAPGRDGLSRRDRAHAHLARAVALVRSGEMKAALADLDAAWDGLATWDRAVRELTIQTALEAGDAGRLEAWLPSSGLPPSEQEIYRAWGVVLTGDVMRALAMLETLPQAHSLVGYLQALALVEQGRFEEAAPWVERTEKLLPGRPEVEVARARVDLRVGDKKTALRRLEALAEEEAYAPRAWTGFGEAHLLQDGKARDLRAAKKALEEAIEREPIPAEAMRLLGEVWTERRSDQPQAEAKALRLFERAAKINAFLPRYDAALAMHLADIGYDKRARALFDELATRPGVSREVLLRRVQLEIEATDGVFALDEPLETLAELGVAAADLELERARAELRQGTRESLESAKTRLQGLLEQDPMDVETRVMLATAHARLFDKNDAKTIILRGLATVPEQQQGRLHFALADIQARFGRRVQAGPRARKAWMSMRDEGRPTRELLAVASLATNLWIRNKRDTVAVAIARELTSRIEYHPQAWTIRARTELAAGDTSEARTSAQRAIKLDPSRPEPHEIEGHCLLRFGYKDKARQAYERAIDLASGSSVADYRANLERL